MEPDCAPGPAQVAELGPCPSRPESCGKAGPGGVAWGLGQGLLFLHLSSFQGCSGAVPCHSGSPPGERPAFKPGSATC